MEYYNFTLNRKYTVWERETHEVSAESEEEAKEKMIELFKNAAADYNELDTFIEVETLYDSMEQMTPTENGGEATAELLTMGGEIIVTNSK